MKSVKTLLPLILISAVLAISCNKSTCIEKNPILENNDSNSEVYKAELAKQLQSVDKSKISYYLKSYHKENDSKYMMVNIESKDLCGQMKIDFEDSTKGAESIIDAKGKSYSGAELKDLVYEIKQDADNVKFVFVSLDGIVD